MTTRQLGRPPCVVASPDGNHHCSLEHEHLGQHRTTWEHVDVATVADLIAEHGQAADAYTPEDIR